MTRESHHGVSDGPGTPTPVGVRGPQSNDQTMSPDAEAGLGEVLGLIGEEVCVLAAEWPRDLDRTGDVDCAVRGLDRWWPLRLPAGYRLIHARNYDMNSWIWTIERNGRMVPFDCVDDPRGIARYKFPTALVECGDRLLPSAPVRAAYLTIKRIRKGSDLKADWETIEAIAAEDRSAYEHLLESLLGRACAEDVATSITGRGPDAALRRRALRLLWIRRFRRPSLAMQAVAKGSIRWFTRWTHPTGLVVVVAGPDGSGKSTLAAEMPAVCAGGAVFLRHEHAHWRPGLLPSLGSLAGVPAGDPTEPHARPPHPGLVSAAALVYYWLDFLLGGIAFSIPKARSGLVVVERGWWDMVVDPARYRIDAPRWMSTLMGNLLVQPDLVIVLEGHPAVLLGRSAELDRTEILRQTREWRTVLPRRVRRATIDASAPVEEVRAAAREAVFSVVADRAAGRVGSGWVGFPTASSPRWLLPRGPRRAARAALGVYQPIAARARIGWEVARLLASTGLMQLLPGGGAPSEEVRAALAPHVPRRSTYSVLRANHPGRYVALIVGASGRPHGLAKVATDESAGVALEAEAENIERLGALLESPIRAPRILARSPDVLLLEPVRWVPRARPWMLPAEVAEGLGRAFTRSPDGSARGGMTHGDCAPWNLLRERDGWVFVDWEEARSDGPPLFDVAHWLVQSHILVGKPSAAQILDPLSVPWIGGAIDAWSAGAGQVVDSWRPHLVEYMRTSLERFDRSDPAHARAIAGRRRLLAAAGG
jgi:Phosphotransferase enzyme family